MNLKVIQGLAFAICVAAATEGSPGDPDFYNTVAEIFSGPDCGEESFVWADPIFGSGGSCQPLDRHGNTPDILSYKATDIYPECIAETYADWCKEDLEHLLGHWSQILDDETLYASCADDWSRVLLRVPAIADTIRYTYETDDIVQEDEEDFDRPGPGEEFKMGLYEAGRQEKTMLFLVDEQALRAGLVKILWLDIHGKCVWENRLGPHNLLEFRGRMFDGGSLADLYDGCEYVDMYEPGALLEID
ncbi:hypothetical protein GL218_02918 [Daldinia childiae]|uniref:uncharacterized protein n=1 Tax=Daldinia childiae TaxID=326645 RepID=UPI001447430D|nr:uncharacterized protein GL218_02918 [Daldinia childiae]KAF3062406.1 hypothetical protein GL218_02918 [Daldinia childiae]